MNEILKNIDFQKRKKLIRTSLVLVVFLASTIFFSLGLSSRETDNMEAQDLDIAAKLYFNNALDLPQDQSPAFYIFMHFWEPLSHSSYGFLRFPSAVFAGIAVTLIFLLMEMEVGVVGGLIAAFFMTTSPYHIWFARFARCYSMTILFTAACMFFAYLYLVREKKIRYIAGFLVFAVLGIYSHLFMLICVASFGVLFALDLVRNWKDWKNWVRSLSAAAIGLLAIYPQVHRIWSVDRAMVARNAIFPGIAHKPMVFLKEFAHGYFMGVTSKAPPHEGYYLIAFTILLVLGIIALKWRGILTGLVVFGMALGISWHLTATTPVSPRYLIYILPFVFCFLAALPARLKSPFVWVPVTIAIAYVNIHNLHLQYPEPRTDWNDLGKFIEQNRRPGDVAAVFPGYWKPTLRRYYQNDDTIAFSQVEDLERIRVRGQRVFVIQGTSRYFGAVENYIKKRTDIETEFQTKVRTRLHIFLVKALEPEKIELASGDDPSLVLAGMVGSGGYPWQLDQNPQNPFERLAPVFKSADLALAAYAPYAPAEFSWVRRIFWSSDGPPRAPNPQVVDFLAKSGIGAVAMLSIPKNVADPSSLLTQAGLKVVPLQPKWSSAQASIFRLKNRDVAVLWCGQNVYTDRPNHKGGNDAVVADWEGAINRAKAKVGADGRLVVLMPQPADYDRLPRLEDQMIARRAIELGADAVVGMGGWAFKEIEDYKDGVIAYSIGSLRRPPYFNLCMLSSTGVVLRLTFPEGGKVRYEIVPVTFDDSFKTALGQNEKLENIHFASSNNLATESLIDRILYSRVNYVSHANKTYSVPRWTASAQAGSSVHEGYFAGGTGVGVAGVNSQCLFHRVLYLKPQDNKKVSITIPKVRLGDNLRLTFGVDDAFIHWKKKDDETLIVSTSKKTLFVQKVKNITGWNTAMIKTKELAGQEEDLTFSVECAKKDNFPISIDPVVIRSEEQVEAMNELPYRFEEHLREARVKVVDKDGVETPCLGPDEAYRHLYGGNKKTIEEDGAYGEGVLHTRWYCSSLPWDASALTVQKSGGDLRPAIWLHPLKDATRMLTFGPVKIRSEIEGFFGFTDLVVKKKVAPVDFVVLLDGKEVFRQNVPATSGWQPFKFDLPESLKSTDAEITFIVETKNQTWDHFCFNAWMN